MNAVLARYVRLDVVENGAGTAFPFLTGIPGTSGFAGLGEVQFFGTVVPEPSTLMLIAIAGGVLLTRFRWHRPPTAPQWRVAEAARAAVRHVSVSIPRLPSPAGGQRRNFAARSWLNLANGFLPVAVRPAVCFTPTRTGEFSFPYRKLFCIRCRRIDCHTGFSPKNRVGFSPRRRGSPTSDGGFFFATLVADRCSPLCRGPWH